MSDIVERLNDLIGEIDTTGKCNRPETASVAMEDARDELTRLREQVTDLQRYQQALRFIAISLQEHFDGIGMEVSSSYHHCVVLPDMIRAAIQGKDQPALSSEECALLARFMEDEPKDRPDRVVEMLRGMRAKVSALEDVRTVLKREADALKADNAALRAGIGRCYRMLLSEPVAKGAVFKAENILRNLIESAPVPAAAPVAQVVPEGWQLVPVEPSDAMLEEAVFLAAAENVPALLSALRKIYRAMLSAAPQPPVVKDSLTTQPPPTATEDAKDAGRWRPIETAPKDGTAVLLGNAYGTWIARYKPVFSSGYRADDPWFSMMLNHDHMGRGPGWGTPTQWAPIPAIDAAMGDEGNG